MSLQQVSGVLLVSLSAILACLTHKATPTVRHMKLSFRDTLRLLKRNIVLL